MKVQIARWGNSAAIRLPKPILEGLRVTAGSEVEVWVEGNEMRLRPTQAIPIYRLEDLVSQIDPNNIPEMIDFGPDVGAEIIDDDYSR